MSNATFADKSIPGGIVHNPASAYAREMAKWEMGYSPYGPPGRPRETVGHQEWPAMFYKCTRSATNGDILTEHETEAASAAEGEALERQGYVRGLANAHAAVEAYEGMIAKAAAERAFADRKMSESARAEAARVDDLTVGHVAEIPEAKKRRGRPAKVTETA